MTWGRDGTIQGHWVLPVWCIEMYFTVSHASKLFALVTIFRCKCVYPVAVFKPVLYLSNNRTLRSVSLWNGRLPLPGYWLKFLYFSFVKKRLLYWNSHILAINCDGSDSQNSQLNHSQSVLCPHVWIQVNKRQTTKNVRLIIPVEEHRPCQ